MEDIALRNSCQEVYYILYHLDINDFAKIPETVITYIDSYRNKDYDYSFDASNRNYSELTAAILLTIYHEYIADEKSKKTLEDIIKLKEKESFVKERINENNNFKSSRTDNEVKEPETLDSEKIEIKQSSVPIEYKENLFTIIISKIKKFFNFFKKK